MSVVIFGVSLVYLWNKPKGRSNVFSCPLELVMIVALYLVATTSFLVYHSEPFRPQLLAWSRG